MSTNRNKRSVCIDITTIAGRQLVLDLAAESDVIVENFLPGKMDTLGLSYSEVARVNPLIVYCSISGAFTACVGEQTFVTSPPKFLTNNIDSSPSLVLILTFLCPLPLLPIPNCPQLTRYYFFQLFIPICPLSLPCVPHYLVSPLLSTLCAILNNECYPRSYRLRIGRTLQTPPGI